MSCEAKMYALDSHLHFDGFRNKLFLFQIVFLMTTTSTDTKEIMCNTEMRRLRACMPFCTWYEERPKAMFVQILKEHWGIFNFNLAYICDRIWACTCFDNRFAHICILYSNIYIVHSLANNLALQFRYI